MMLPKKECALGFSKLIAPEVPGEDDGYTYGEFLKQTMFFFLNVKI